MRTCGDCTLCCTLTFVPELHKIEGVTCDHCEGGCRIYAGRPESCAKYACSWLSGSLPDFMRPDLSGVMIEEYHLMVAALLKPNVSISDLAPEVVHELDQYVEAGFPVIATGQFAKLPKGMPAEEAKRRMIQTIREVRPA